MSDKKSTNSSKLFQLIIMIATSVRRLWNTLWIHIFGNYIYNQSKIYNFLSCIILYFVFSHPQIILSETFIQQIVVLSKQAEYQV